MSELLIKFELCIISSYRSLLQFAYNIIDLSKRADLKF